MFTCQGRCLLCILSLPPTGASWYKCCILHLPIGVNPASGRPAPDSQISLKTANIIAGRYVYAEDLTKLEKCTDRDFLDSWPICPSPIRLAGWMEFVIAHPDHRFASYIYSGLTSGFCIGFDRQATTLWSATRNHPSASENTLVV